MHLFFFTFFYRQGRVDTVKYERVSNERKILSPSIPGDKSGETEEFRRFFNEKLQFFIYHV